MDSIPFEKVSLEEAKTAAKEAVVEAPVVREKNWSPQRQGNEAAAVKVTINNDVLAWLGKLPPDVRPRALAIQFPRIFNKLAELWGTPQQCEKFLDELLLDERGTRKGFPPDVALELTALKMHFNKTAGTQKFDVWGERLGD